MSWSAFGDWGTSRLRLAKIEAGRVTAVTEGPGIGRLKSPAAKVLNEALLTLDPSSPDEIRLCGMAGARTGLYEADYAACPADLATWQYKRLDVRHNGVPLSIAAGVATTDDIMRGEETQVFGALSLDRCLESVVLPGTHSKWVDVERGAIVGLNTYPTGELYALLQEHSTLAANDSGDASDEEIGFSAALDLVEETSIVLGALFGARVQQLRRGASGLWAKGFVSGVLIGGEIAERARLRRLPAELTLIGAGGLCERYTQALSRLGVRARSLDPQECALRGLEDLHAIS